MLSFTGIDVGSYVAEAKRVLARELLVLVVVGIRNVDLAEPIGRMVAMHFTEDANLQPPIPNPQSPVLTR